MKLSSTMTRLSKLLRHPHSGAGSNVFERKLSEKRHRDRSRSVEYKRPNLHDSEATELSPLGKSNIQDAERWETREQFQNADSSAFDSTPVGSAESISSTEHSRISLSSQQQESPNTLVETDLSKDIANGSISDGARLPKPHDPETDSRRQENEFACNAFDAFEVSPGRTSLVRRSRQLVTIDESAQLRWPENDTLIFDDSRRTLPRSASYEVCLSSVVPLSEAEHERAILRRPTSHASAFVQTRELSSLTQGDTEVALLKSENLRLRDEVRHLRAQVGYLEARDEFYTRASPKIKGLPRVLSMNTVSTA